ncbi:FHA domain-containing protein [Granulicella arctica]|uniref:FHA domain-containing protein n=1 Tax=Granulicella arctica TaxID=940613 RepID=UPI0021DF589A|nr:FHA domain-containing protein [Granulicella arctica]
MSESPQPDPNTIKITLDDLEAITLPSPAAIATTSTSGTSIYGTINDMPDDPTLPAEKPSIWLQGWLYLGSAGLLGALAGWGICEHAFVDNGTGAKTWGNIWLLPLIVALMCVAFGIAESLVERSARKGLIRVAIALPLGIVFGFIFDFIANLIYNIGLGILGAAGVQSFHNPAVWLVRGIAWMAFGAAGGLVYGIIGKSGRKAGYGALGGALGALLGGAIFDPIAFLMERHSAHGAAHSAAPSRAIGFALLGMATGIAMGLVESALKDRWLYVTAGPLAGKQFILYKPVTTLGSNQQADIYLFKDAEILPAHATLLLKGSRIHVVPTGTVYVGGSPIRGTHVLQSGSILRIGRYGFRYQEKQR